MRLKYIITRNNSPVLFSEAESHNEVASRVGAISAGFVDIEYLKAHDVYAVDCYGSSISLGMNSSKGDSVKIAQMLNKKFYT